MNLDIQMSHFTVVYLNAFGSNKESQNPEVISCSAGTGELSVGKDQGRKARAEGGYGAVTPEVFASFPKSLGLPLGKWMINDEFFRMGSVMD